jgi:SAM-dependent methyltransferase
MTVLAHNEKAGATWGSGGAAYDAISELIADSIEHLLARVDVKPGERVLDLATGTGWTARRLAQKGARVTGVDIGAGVIAAAQDFAKRASLEIVFQVGDAERVTLPDGAFDVVTSTCGVMFASNPEAVAGELARLCRRGGRVGLTTWPVGGTIERLFQVMRPYMPAPPVPPPPSPFLWGDPKRVTALLGRDFELVFEPATTVLRAPSAERVWEVFSTGYGPTKALWQSVTDKEGLRRDFIAMHDEYRTPAGIAMPRDYLMVVGTRR